MQKLLYILAGVVLGVALIVVVNVKAAKPEATIYEYGVEGDLNRVNGLGKEGWRMISSYADHQGFPHYVLKRPVKK